MAPLFYYRLEADYLIKVKIYQLNKRNLFKKSTEISFGWGRDNKVDTALWIESIFEDNSLCCKRLEFLYLCDNKKYNYFVNLDTTYCNYGGIRYWFKCPHCDRRVGVLYLRGEYFLCRHCNYLTYESKKISGLQKNVGRIISDNEVEEIKNEVKRKYYRGNMTRKYERYLKIKSKAEMALCMTTTRLFGGA